MSERLYYDAAYSREFDATVTRVEVRDGRQAVWLDRSAFYPASGGQPDDAGTIASAKVVDVADEDGEVVHTIDGVVPLEAGQHVHGAIDWSRRFDHMQQHTGQHVLSAAFVRSVDVATASFHLGTELSTIDLAREVSATEIARAEQLANSVVWESRPVSVSYAEAGEAAAMGLRKPSARGGRLRLIEIQDFDRSACGGTHVKATSEIGMIAVTGAERFKGGSRIEFACGARALAQFRLLRESTAASVKLLSVLPQELPAAIERLQAEVRDYKRSAAASNEELAAFRADLMLAAAEPFGTGRAVFAVLDADAQSLRALASTITRTPGLLVVLVGRSAPLSLALVARSRDLSYACDAIIKSGIERFGGRGGGKPDMAQAGGLDAAPEDILSYLRAMATVTA